MLVSRGRLLLLAASLHAVAAMQYRADLADYNLNTNQQATAVTDFTTTRANKTYTVCFFVFLSFNNSP